MLSFKKLEYILEISYKTKLKWLIFFSKKLLLFFICFSSYSSFTQNAPKIGLVLSGGGAKGLAHIGILKSLEEAGIVPDVITGTSMGSIMGGLYAIGYSADEIKAIALQADWDQLLTNKKPMDEVAYEEKAYFDRYTNILYFSGVHFDLPIGMIEGQKLSLLLSKLTQPVSNIHDFNDFPIPYACIAADIETGEKVVLNEGSLSRAMRASMAIPTVFTPVEMDGRVLVDGGLVHNFPVEENLDIGADIIIGVFVGTELLKKEELNSPIDVLTQSAFIHGSFDNAEQKKLVDIYIEPDLEGYSTSSFNDAAEIIKIGEEYGKKYLDVFKQLKDSIENLGHVNRKVVKPLSIDSIYVAQLKIHNNEIVSDKFIIDRLEIKEKQWITFSALEKRINHLHGSGYFLKILYETIPVDDGTILNIHVKEYPEGQLKNSLQFDSETETDLLINLTYRNLFFDNSRFIVESEISKNPLLDINYLKYFGERQNLSFITGYYFRNTDVPVFENDNTTGIFSMNYNLLYAGIQKTQRINMNTSIVYSNEYAKLKPDIIPNSWLIYDKIQVESHNLSVGLHYNSLNRRYLPTSGQKFNFSAKYTFPIDLNFRVSFADTLSFFDLSVKTNNKIKPEFSHNIVIPVSNKIHVNITNELCFNIDFNVDSTNNPSGVLDEYYIGGFRELLPNSKPFWGAEALEYSALNMFFNQITLQYMPTDKFFILLNSQFYHAHYPTSWFLHSIKDDYYYLGGKDYLLGLGGSFGFLTPLGPMSVSMGKDINQGKLHYFINLGFYFDR